MSQPPPSSQLQTHTSLVEEERPRYSTSELQDYFERISLPARYREHPILRDGSLAKTKEYGLPFLRNLARYHTCNVPFENLELHYSVSRKITLDPSDLYTKIVRRRRGGRCMENNTFFATVLRSLGYELRNCGGRVSRSVSPYPEVRRSQGLTYDGWNHMLNLVRLDDEWYVIDVGMGAMGPNLPYPLQDGFETTSIAPRRIRLQLRPIAESYATASSVAEPPKMWCYDVCYKPSSDDEAKNAWLPIYCFTETEFLPQDYEMMSWFTSTHQRSFFTKMLTCTRMVMGEDGEAIVGDLTLVVETIRRTVGGQREVVRECASEAERVQALEEMFGVELTEEERKAISAGVSLG
ncbi:hypothetical protein LTR53_011583 [Teratosphaeriaceae sp. CCFEE 6253]|nr:hypothetical protein LTR53_011583 [Teratosphaeriaceae sp. CCFEE 6253]